MCSTTSILLSSFKARETGGKHKSIRFIDFSFQEGVSLMYKLDNYKKRNYSEPLRQHSYTP